MPKMDGMEMCNKIKSNPLTQQIPIILLTALDSKESSIKGLHTGADAYITKPFNEDVLIARVHNLIKERKRLREVFGGNYFDEKDLSSKAREDQEFIKACIELIYEYSEKQE